jgi:hypothetical protein
LFHPAQQANGPMASESIKLADDDEADVILDVARDVAARLGLPSIRMNTSADSLKSVRALALRRYRWAGSNAAFVGQLINYFNPGEISRDDLTVLAPYIDDWLNGNPPPFWLASRV